MRHRSVIHRNGKSQLSITCVALSREAGQLRAINLVKDWGGMAGFVTCDVDVMNVFKEFMAGLSK